MVNNPWIGIFTAALIYFLLLINESPNVTRNIDCLPWWQGRNFARYFLRFVLFIMLIRNLLMKFRGVPEKSSKPGSRSAIFSRFFFQISLKMLIRVASIEQKNDAHEVLIQKRGEVSKVLHPRWLLLLKNYRELDYPTTCIWLNFFCVSCLD